MRTNQKVGQELHTLHAVSSDNGDTGSVRMLELSCSTHM